MSFSPIGTRRPTVRGSEGWSPRWKIKNVLNGGWDLVISEAIARPFQPFSGSLDPALLLGHQSLPILQEKL